MSDVIAMVTVVMVTWLQVQLTRLSKMFQQSARVAIETTVLSADVGRMVVSPSPHVACLPRWSSAPASLGAGARGTAGARATADADAEADEPDTTSPTYVAPSVRRKLKQVFSYDVGVMARSQERAQHAAAAVAWQRRRRNENNATLDPPLQTRSLLPARVLSEP